MPTTTTTHLSPDILLRCTIFDSSGSATSTSGVFKKSRLCSDHGLEPRDLRKIDSRVPNLVPTILARRGGILVNILHIRAMIKKDKVLLFDSYGSTDSQLNSAFVYNLQHNLKSLSSAAGGGSRADDGSGNATGIGCGVGGGAAGAGAGTGASAGALAYEFRALESILVSVLDALRIELGVVRNWTSNILQDLDDDVDREKLRTLLQVSRKLNAFLSRAKAVKNAVTEVLENEEDMGLMYLSHPPPPPCSNNSTITEGEPSGPPEMDELELLLESFDKQVEEVVSETTQLSSDISNTQEVVELILDNNRNKLLALDLKTSIATMGISAGTLWAGLFGMNLKSHMEEMDYAFAGVSGVAVIAVGITMGVGLRRLQRLRRVGLGSGAARGAKRRVPEKKRRWWARLRGEAGKEASVRKVEEGVNARLGVYPPGYGMYYPPQYGQHQGYPAPPSAYATPYPTSNQAASGEQGAPARWPNANTNPAAQTLASPPSTSTGAGTTDDIGGAEPSVASPSASPGKKSGYKRLP
ncbi:hypothetical protein NDA13_005716 [Ustilago tritici]|nr:hypothetical protein NDA13_005716 [Ustilago tritici]